MRVINKKDIVYYARILPETGVYDVCELFVRTVEDDYFVGIDKRDKHAYLFGYNAVDDIIFDNRKDALKRVQEAEKNKKEISEETYYEEY